MRKDVKDLLDKANQSIEAAELLLKDNFEDFSAGRSYYAMFYCVEALFLNQDRSFSRHSAIISAFGKEFIKTGIFPKKFHRYILEGFDMRNTGDYGTMYSIGKDKANELI
ncbi:MAG: HEPN domain-containing protein, partial [Planctomycetes bacterium]|nr:HEPN domain-containing protein [Planctomycetota bacterium]